MIYSTTSWSLDNSPWRKEERRNICFFTCIFALDNLKKPNQPKPKNPTTTKQNKQKNQTRKLHKLSCLVYYIFRDFWVSFSKSCSCLNSQLNSAPTRYTARWKMLVVSRILCIVTVSRSSGSSWSFWKGIPLNSTTGRGPTPVCS